MAQQPLNIGTGVESGDGDPLRVIFAKISSNFADLDGRLISSTAIISTLGNAAFKNFGTVAGTVADGGALTAESTRATAAEQANATAIQTNATAIANETSRAQGIEALKAPIASPTFTGIPSVPTAAAGTSTTQAASTAFVTSAVAAGGGGGSGGVPTSRQILGGGLATGGGDLTADRTITVPKAAQSDVAAGTDDAKALTSYSVAARLGALAPLASPAFVGTPTAPTAAAGTNTTQLATTAFAASAVATETSRAQGVEATLAPLASPSFTGTPRVPTATAGATGTQAASLDFVSTAISAASQSLGNTGYKRLPGGVTIQWGRIANTNGDISVSFPVPFSAAPWVIVGTAGSSGATSTLYVFETNMSEATATSFNARTRLASNGGTVAQAGLDATWFAIGPS